jgi:hypothetical protein
VLDVCVAALHAPEERFLNSPPPTLGAATHQGWSNACSTLYGHTIGSIPRLLMRISSIPPPQFSYNQKETARGVEEKLKLWWGAKVVGEFTIGCR